MASGYDVNFNDNIDPRFLCPICLLVIRNAVQTACGHRFCEGCLSRIAKCGQGSLFSCPVDKTMTHSDKIFPDVATRREILSVPLACNNTENGCLWRGELRDVEKHLDTCEYNEVTCPNSSCSAKFMRRELDAHVAQCPGREVQCDHCQRQVLFSALEAHKEVCPKVKITCPVCHKAEILREETNAHTDPGTGDCPMVKTNCAFASMGCEFTAERYLVQEHITQTDVLQQHLCLAAAMITSHRETILTMQETIAKLRDKTNEIVPTVMNSQRRLGQISREMRDRNVTGKLQWKVKLRGYNRGRNTSYCSPTFYTGCPGYKVQLTLNMEGFREGREWFASLILSLLPGEYDDSVVFPFNATCDVTLFDQSESVTQCQNYEQQIVVRQVPRNSRPGHSGGYSNCHRRAISKFIPRRDLIGPASKYMRDGCLHFEVTVLHSVFPSPDCAGAPSAMMCPCPCPSTPAAMAATTALRRSILFRNHSPVGHASPHHHHHHHQNQQHHQQQQAATSGLATPVSDTPTQHHQAIMGVAALSLGN